MPALAPLLSFCKLARSLSGDGKNITPPFLNPNVFHHGYLFTMPKKLGNGSKINLLV